ncbi:hypothetical protein HPB50_013649 [Hyalomma asiaticum]|uniref:Uncharacterized protein n=1 Tax=Hyalomma asiaticum TaxID=266040 RepID=A0ACB7THD1_HYAAI|nr:hypothetical protein HPB50_013649 [Hyalomma asiaticum]
MRRETRFNGCSPISVDINASVTNRSNWSNQIKQRRRLSPAVAAVLTTFPVAVVWSCEVEIVSFQRWGQENSLPEKRPHNTISSSQLQTTATGNVVRTAATAGQFLLKEKVDILTELNAGKKQVDICRERDIAPSTVATILKDQEIMKLHRESQLAPSRKRWRLGNYQTVDDAVLTWFKDARQHGVPLSGPIIQGKARQFAVALGTSGFDASAGWLYRSDVVVFLEKSQSYLRCCKDVPEDILRKVADMEAYMHQRLLSTRQKKITDFFKQ